MFVYFKFKSLNSFEDVSSFNLIQEQSANTKLLGTMEIVLEI